MDILEKVLTIIGEVINKKKEEIKPEDKLVETLALDELDIVELVLALEEQFDIFISDEDAEKFVMVQDVVNYITEKTKESGESGNK